MVRNIITAVLSALCIVLAAAGALLLGGKDRAGHEKEADGCGK